MKSRDKVICFDVDDTLVMWKYEGESDICINDNNLKRNLIHIEKVKEISRKGKFVIVWSQSGHLWADAVVKALELESYVDLIISKPEAYYDDLACHIWMGERRYESIFQ